ncbi:MAG: signal peptidase II [Deltaproteobacteria bacterium]|nr:signal peptidase II [Deltaproteobacteria bacterium]
MSERARQPRGLYLVITLSVALTAGALDLLAKWMALAALPGDRAVSVLPGLLDLRLQANPHGAFGLFSSFAPGLRLPLLLGLAVLAMVSVCLFSVRTLGWSRSVAVALGLVLGGALANLVDRIARGGVVDYIHLHAGEWLDWATFNLADVAISAGSLALMAVVIRHWARDPARSEAPCHEEELR